MARRGGLGNSRRFRSLAKRNFRIYFIAQLVSLAGTFTQTVAQAWLVLKLGGDGVALGIVTSCQYLPMLFFGGFAGVLIDRFRRRDLLMVTQALAGAEAVLLGILTVTGTVELWMIYVMALVLGVITAVDQPARQTFVHDLVGGEDVSNAVALNLAMAQSSRVIGPTLAGVLIALIGIGPCFFVNAASFGALLIGLLMMRSSELHVVPPQARLPRQFREGVRYVRKSPVLLAFIGISSVFFGLAWEYDVIMPLIAKYTFGGGPATYAVLMASIGVGSVIASLAIASSAPPTNRLLASCLTVFAGAMMAASLAPSIVVMAPFLAVMGGSGIVGASVLSSRLQLDSNNAMRGRVMSLFSVAAIGTRPIGAPLVGAIAARFGPRYGLAFGAAVMVPVAAYVWTFRGARPRRTVSAPDTALALEATEATVAT